MVLELTQENFEAQVTNSDLPVVIDFYADWCGPCQMMKPVFEEASKKFEGKAKFMKLDTQENQELAQKFGIQGIPAFSVVKGQTELGKFVGAMSVDAFSDKVNEVLQKA